MMDDAGRYSKLSGQEAQAHDDADTETETGLRHPIRDDAAIKRRLQRSSRCCSYGFALRVFVEVLVVLAVLLALEAVFIWTQSAANDAKQPAGFGFLPDDVKRISLARRFEEEPQYENQTAEANQAWDDLMPHGRGYIEIDDPEQYGLNLGQEDMDHRKQYAISAFHQLHCLAQLRSGYYQVRNDPSSGSATHDRHMSHCFNYVRQALMCAADPAIEPSVFENGGARRVGWHACRDWDGLVAFVLGHRANDLEGILNDADLEGHHHF